MHFLCKARCMADTRPTKTQNGSRSVVMTVGMKEKMIWVTICLSESIGRPDHNVSIGE